MRYVLRPCSMRVAALAAVLALNLSGCTSSIELLKKTTPVPEAVEQPVVPKPAKAVAMSDIQNNEWWTVVKDPALTKVIEQALQNNTDLRLAEQRLNEAAAVMGITKTAAWPAIFAQITQSRSRPTQSGNVPVFGSKSIYDSNRAVIGMSWELDLWGRLGNLSDAAEANFEAQGYNLAGTRLSISALAATLYTRIRVFELLLKTGVSTLESRQQAYELQKMRFEAGLSNELQFRQIEAEYLALQSQLPDLRLQLANANNALSVVLGGEAFVIPSLGENEVVLSPLLFIPEALPSELLTRRPDLAAAEAQLRASDANLAAARKAFLPSISLTGTAGSESAELSDLFSGPAKVWNVAANITQPIFQAGRLFDERDAVLARRNQAVITYEAAVRQAFSEVYDALAAQREARERLSAREQQVSSLRRLTELARLRVEAGVSSQLELLDAQRNLLAAEMEWARAWGTQQAAGLAVIRALGGGFELPIVRGVVDE